MKFKILFANKKKKIWFESENVKNVFMVENLFKFI